jgi:hypothetical protein
MKALKKTLLGAGLALVALSSSGCLKSRVIRSMAQSSDKNVTLVETFDLYTYLVMDIGKHQFWKCGEVPGTITCQKVCDAKGSDLTCPGLFAYGMAGDNVIK